MTVRELGSKADPGDDIRVDGRRLRARFGPRRRVRLPDLGQDLPRAAE